MLHDPRLVPSEDKIEELRKTIPDWIKHLERPATPCIAPSFGPLKGIRVVGTGQLVAQPYIGTKLAEFGAEVIHVERPGGDVFRFTAPQLTRGPRPHGCDEAEVTKNKLSLGLDLKQTRAIEVLMALWKISDVWMESSMPGTLERIGITNELAFAVNPSLVIVRSQHLRAIRQRGVSRASGLRRDRAGLWRHDEPDRRSGRAAAACQDLYRGLRHSAHRMGCDDDGIVGG